MDAKTYITIQATIKASVNKVWDLYTTPRHIMQWNNASDDWHTPHAENDLRPGGKFLYRMEAKDGSFGFDFDGIFDIVNKYELIVYTISDGRKVIVSFDEIGNETHVRVEFEAEDENPAELQQKGWQAILNHFKKYTEAAQL